MSELILYFSQLALPLHKILNKQEYAEVFIYYFYYSIYYSVFVAYCFEICIRKPSTAKQIIAAEKKYIFIFTDTAIYFRKEKSNTERRRRIY